MADKFVAVLQNYRWYDDGTEAASSQLEAENTAADVTLGSGNVQAQLRVMIEETGSGSVSGATTDDYTLEYRINGAGGWTAITGATSRVQADTGASLTNDGATTNRSTDGVSDGSGSFIAGVQEGGTGADGEITDYQLTANNFTEHVWGLLFIDADNTAGDFLTFRVAINGSNITSTNEPRIDFLSGSTTNTVTIDTGQTVDVTDIATGANALPLRERNRTPADTELSNLATDTSIELRERNRTPADTELSNLVTDSFIQQGPGAKSFRYIVRGRIQSDTELSNLLTDDKTATYVEGGGSVVNTVTITGANNYAATTDAIVALRQRQRVEVETSEVTDATALIRERNRAQTDTSDVTDTSLTLRERSRTQADTSDVTDTSLTLRERSRTPADSITVEDVNSQWITNNEVPTESIDAADDSVELRERNRVTSDSIVVLDDATATYVGEGAQISNVTLQDLDSVAAADDSIELRERNRAQSDSIDTTDSLGSPVITTTLFDSITVEDVSTSIRLTDGELVETIDATDDAIERRERNRTPSDSLDVADSSTGETTRARQLTDSIDVSETLQSVRERLRLLTDSATVTDSAIVTLDQDVVTATLSDSLSVTDSLTATRVSRLPTFRITHGIEALEIDYGLARGLSIKHGIREETG